MPQRCVNPSRTVPEAPGQGQVPRRAPLGRDPTLRVYFELGPGPGRGPAYLCTHRTKKVAGQRAAAPLSRRRRHAREVGSALLAALTRRQNPAGPPTRGRGRGVARGSSRPRLDNDAVLSVGRTAPAGERGEDGAPRRRGGWGTTGTSWTPAAGGTGREDAHRGVGQARAGRRGRPSRPRHTPAGRLGTDWGPCRPHRAPLAVAYRRFISGGQKSFFGYLNPV